MLRRLIATFALVAAVLPVSVLAQDLPNLPDPVTVTLDRATAALLVLDMNDSTCATLPACVDTVPAVASLLAWARNEGLTVVHSTTARATAWIEEVAPMEGEPTVLSGADKFFNTDLDAILKERGITSTIMVGTFANGAVLYTAFGATQRGQTVVVADDGLSSPTPFATFAAKWQLLNSPSGPNPSNDPARPRAVTLSHSDLITIGSVAAVAASPAGSFVYVGQNDFGHWMDKPAGRPYLGLEVADLDAFQREVIAQWEKNKINSVWVYDVEPGPENDWAAWGPPPPGYTTRSLIPRTPEGAFLGGDMPWPPAGQAPAAR